MSTAKERQAKRRAKIRADSELHQELLQDRERKKCQRKAQKENMSEHQLEEHRLKERLRMDQWTSDGPTSQFKQRFLFSNLHHWEQDHDITIRMNFFATSHGKGVVDGIGGTVKRSVETHSVREKSCHHSTRLCSTCQTAVLKCSD